MGTDILLGIDLGTTVLKAGAFDRGTGTLLASAARRLPVGAATDERREQTLPGIRVALASVLSHVRSQLGRAWGRAAGIGVAAQGGSSIIVERETGSPVTPMMLWSDGRGRAYESGILQRLGGKTWQRRLLATHLPAGLGRLRWLQETRPDLLTEDHLHVGAGEYLFHCLTGLWRQDPGNAIQIGSYNAASGKLDPFLFGALGIPLSFVAPLRRGHQAAPLSKEGSRMLCLHEGIPVAGPYIDQEAGYLAAAGESGRPLQCSLGTAWVGNFVLPPGVKGGSPFQLVLPSPVDTGRLIVQPLLTGNAAWDWALKAFIDPDLDQAIKKAEAVFKESLTPPDGLVALPWHAQPNPFAMSAPGGGAFMGIHTQTDPADLVRAMAAGMAFELARVFEGVRQAGIVDQVVLGGGASRGAYFRNLIAALFAPLSVHRQTDEDLSTARGAVFSFDAQAAHARTQPVRVPARLVREKIKRQYALYCYIYEKVFRRTPDSAPFKCGR